MINGTMEKNMRNWYEPQSRTLSFQYPQGSARSAQSNHSMLIILSYQYHPTIQPSHPTTQQSYSSTRSLNSLFLVGLILYEQINPKTFNGSFKNGNHWSYYIIGNVSPLDLCNDISYCVFPCPYLRYYLCHLLFPTFVCFPYCWNPIPEMKCSGQLQQLSCNSFSSKLQVSCLIIFVLVYYSYTSFHITIIPVIVFILFQYIYLFCFSRQKHAFLGRF